MFPLFLFICTLFFVGLFFFLSSLADFLSICLFLVRWSIYGQFSLPSFVFPVPINMFPSPCVFYSFGKLFPAPSVRLFIGLLPFCRSISFLPVHFLPFCMFPFQSLTLLRIHSSIACLSVLFLVSRSVFCSSDWFLTVGLFPVNQSVSELPVPFPVLLLICLSACFLSIGLFPVFRSVSCPSKSVCVLLIIISFKFIDMFSDHWSVFLHRPISCSSVCYLSTGRFHALSFPCQSIFFPYLGRFMIYCPVSCQSFWLLFICLPVFCPFICYVACLLEQCVPCQLSVSWFPVSCSTLFPGSCPLDILQITLPIYLFLVTCLLFRFRKKLRSWYVLFCSSKLSMDASFSINQSCLYQRLPIPPGIVFFLILSFIFTSNFTVKKNT